MNFCKFPSDKFQLSTSCRSFFILSMLIYLVLATLFSSFIKSPQCQTISSFPSLTIDSPTTLNHIVFGILGSEKAWHHRKLYTGSWWRPNLCRGFLLLDKAPAGELLPWSEDSPPYRVSENLTEFWKDIRPHKHAMMRMVHGILEVFKEVEDENFRWLVMGDDDSIFFIDNMVNVLREYDHTKYYYLGGQSESIFSNFGFSFNQGFGGAGLIFSHPLAKALAQDMRNCLRRYARLESYSADHVTMMCIADIGVNLSPQKGIHQIDLRGDISGFLSSHPKSPLISLHHLGLVAPIFPAMDRFESLRHLMEAAKVDQSRMLQQTICYDRLKNWTFSISWGYSAHWYKKILPRSFLQNPIETFENWGGKEPDRASYIFNTRTLPVKDQSESPHVFFFQEVRETSIGTLTTYTLNSSGESSVDSIAEIQVHSPATRRIQMDRCECCDVIRVKGSMAQLNFRECMLNEIIA